MPSPNSQQGCPTPCNPRVGAIQAPSKAILPIHLSHWQEEEVILLQIGQEAWSVKITTRSTNYLLVIGTIHNVLPNQVHPMPWLVRKEVEKEDTLESRRTQQNRGWRT